MALLKVSHGPATSALAVVLLSLFVASSSACTLNSAADFIMANADRFQITLAVVQKAGLAGVAANGSSAGSYFLATDTALVTAFSKHLPSGPKTTVADVLAAVEATGQEQAFAFALKFNTNVTYTSADALVKAGTVTAADFTPLAVHQLPSGAVSITNTQSGDGSDIAAAAVVPVSQDVTVFLLDTGSLASPAIITGGKAEEETVPTPCAKPGRRLLL